ADDVRVRRALVVAYLPDAEPMLLDDAISALEDSAARLRDTGPPERLRSTLENLGQLRYNRGRLNDAIAAFQESAAIVSRELVEAGTPELLAERAGRHLALFEKLGCMLAEAGRPRDAVAVYETLRGAVPRIAGNDKLRTVTAVRSAM